MRGLALHGNGGRILAAAPVVDFELLNQSPEFRRGFHQLLRRLLRISRAP
jgi:hypothetical protein